MYLRGCHSSGNGEEKNSSKSGNFTFESGKIKVFEKSQGKVKLIL